MLAAGNGPVSVSQNAPKFSVPVPILIQLTAILDGETIQSLGQVRFSCSLICLPSCSIAGSGELSTGDSLRTCSNRRRLLPPPC